MTPVLLIDDEPDIKSLFSMCLERYDVEIVQVTDLAGALSAAERHSFCLVLLDIQLGDEDGLQILPALRRSRGLREVPVVAFTAHDSRRREALERGVDDFLSRSFDARQLRSIVERTLSRGRPITPCFEPSGSWVPS